MNILDKIVTVPFPEDRYFKQEFSKNSVFIHHTVSGPGVMNDIAYWQTLPNRIATAIIIDRDGTPYQCFSTNYWAYHLGVRDEDIEVSGITKYNRLDLTSIGVELDSWGGLVKHSDKQWYPALWNIKKNKYVPNTKCKPVESVQEYKEPFRGFYGYERYTDEQIESLRLLLLYWNQHWGIPLTDNTSTLFDLSADALSGKPGIWSHVSVRLDKSDCHPQGELVLMLQNLNTSVGVSN